MKRLLLLLMLLPLLAGACRTAGNGQAAGDGADSVAIHPIFHGTLALEWQGKTVFIDPYGGAERFASLGTPDLVLITHPHGDHLNKETLRGLNLTNAELIAPRVVVDSLGDIRFGKVTVLANGEERTTGNIRVRAVPMYNLPETADSRHPKGWGNGYVLTMGDERIYVSGDTEDIEEMRKLEDIDIAFVCMNLPYTMTVEQAADAVLAFQPAVVYPYHYRKGDGTLSDVEQFKALVEAGNTRTEVRLEDWYVGK